MQQCGYSRDRATSALMRELSRGDSARPSDHEIFETMVKHNLGIEEATKAIIVSKALRRAMETRSPANAIEHLASKIAVKRLLYDSSDEDPTSEDECFPISPNLRVVPISTLDRNSSKSRLTPVRKARSAPTKANRPRKATATPNKAGVIFRKRSIDEIASAEKPEEAFSPNRSRAGSLAEEVSAKFAQQVSGDDPAVSNPLEATTIRNSSSVRGKRPHRSDESETLGPVSSKRIRGSDA